MRVLGLLVFTAACGRVSFDVRTDADPDARPVVASYPDFATCPGGVTLVGSAVCSAGAVELTSETMLQRGAIWLPELLSTSRSLAIEIRVTMINTIAGRVAGDGMAIVLQDAPDGMNAMGDSGGGLGYAMIAPSVALELDSFPNSNEEINAQHLALDVDGLVYQPDDPEVDVGFDLATGAVVHAWFDYDAETRTMSGAASMTPIKPSAPQITRVRDLTEIGSNVWVGVTAGTGNETSVQRLLSIRVSQ